MTTRDMMDTRIYMMEDAMHRRSDDLNRHLHELESRLKALSETVHSELCEGGPAPLEVKTCHIVRAIEDFEASTDLDGVQAEGERIRSIKGLIDNYEREVREHFGVDGEGSESPRLIDELAAIA
jgi:hypothetical protein